MARSSKSSRKARRRGDNMKLPVALLALAASTAAAGDALTDLNSSDRRTRLLGGRRHLSTQQQHEQQPMEQRRQLQSAMCSCSPTVFHVRLDFSNDCNDDTLKENGGIHATLCQLVDGLPPLASPDGPPLDAPTPTLPPVASTTEPPVATTEPPVELPVPTDPPVFVDDPFLPPRPPSDPAPTPPTDGTTVIPTWSPTTTPPPVNESPGTPDAPGAMPTDWPTWSPTATMWPSTSAGANPGNGDPVPTYAPTEIWPTYAPTPEEGDEVEPEVRGGWVDSTAYLKAHNLLHGEGNSNGESGVSRKQLKKQLKKGLDKHEAHELKKLMRDEDDLSVLEKFAGYLQGMQANSGTAGEPSSRPTSSTPWPTDDGTYAPTGSERRKLEAKRGGAVGRWTSVPPNDAFFAEFPELRAMQEEIYRVRNAERPAGRRLDSGKRQERKKKTGHHTHGMATTQEAVDAGAVPNQLLTAHFLELDASNDMNVINQDDQYLNVTFPPNEAGDPVTSYTLSFNSISALLDPSVPLEEQMGKVPGGVILILVARTASGEVVRNRLIWQYSMGCSAEESVVVESGDAFGWSVFDKLTPPRAEFCPNAPAPATPSPIAGDVPTSRPPTPDIPSKMPSRPSPPSPPSGPTAPSKPTSPSTKAGKPHKPSSSGGSGSSSKSGKALSMPSGDLLDQFDLDSSSSKAAKPAKYSSADTADSGSSSDSHRSSTASSKRSGSSSSSSHHSSSSSHHSSSRRQRNRRAEQRDRSGRQQQQYRRNEQDEAEIFGRRISKHREGAHRTRREKVLFADGDKRLRRRRA